MSRVFPITPASIGVLAVVGISLIPLILLMGVITFLARNVRFVVDDEGLHIKGSRYGRFIPKESVVLGGSRILNLNVERELRPVVRTFGIGFPRASSGTEASTQGG